MHTAPGSRGAGQKRAKVLIEEGLEVHLTEKKHRLWMPQESKQRCEQCPWKNWTSSRPSPQHVLSCFRHALSAANSRTITDARTNETCALRITGTLNWCDWCDCTVKICDCCRPFWEPQSLQSSNDELRFVAQTNLQALLRGCEGDGCVLSCCKGAVIV